MVKRKRKKRHFKLSGLLLFILLVLIIISLIGINFFNKDYQKLRLKGYNKKTSSLIINNKELLEYATDNKYNKILEQLITYDEFKLENLDKYTNYLNNNKDIKNEELLYIVNNELDNYNYEDILRFKDEKYYLMTRLDRYINYYNKHTDLSSTEIVKRVNSNIDYNFYTNDMDTNIEDGILLICNKFYKLKNNYEPNLVPIESSYTRGGGYLEAETYNAFKALSDAARKEGLYILSRSPYRSYATQQYLYNNYVNTDGKALADTYSARPGYSEHQTGLALDVGNLNNATLDSFGNTQEYKWMQENAHKYGFILRYPKGQEYITGYMEENWHYRYVGIEAATIIYNEKITYEEYYTYYVLKR